MNRPQYKPRPNPSFFLNESAGQGAVYEDTDWGSNTMAGDDSSRVEADFGVSMLPVDAMGYVDDGMGNIFKKAGKALQKATKSVTKAVSQAPKKLVQQVKKDVKAVRREAKGLQKAVKQEVRGAKRQIKREIVGARESTKRDFKAIQREGGGLLRAARTEARGIQSGARGAVKAARTEAQSFQRDLRGIQKALKTEQRGISRAIQTEGAGFERAIAEGRRSVNKIGDSAGRELVNAGSSIVEAPASIARGLSRIATSAGKAATETGKALESGTNALVEGAGNLAVPLAKIAFLPQIAIARGAGKLLDKAGDELRPLFGGGKKGGGDGGGGEGETQEMDAAFEEAGQEGVEYVDSNGEYSPDGQQIEYVDQEFTDGGERIQNESGDYYTQNGEYVQGQTEFDQPSAVATRQQEPQYNEPEAQFYQPSGGSVTPSPYVAEESNADIINQSYLPYNSFEASPTGTSEFDSPSTSFNTSDELDGIASFSGVDPETYALGAMIDDETSRTQIFMGNVLRKLAGRISPQQKIQETKKAIVLQKQMADLKAAKAVLVRENGGIDPTKRAFKQPLDTRRSYGPATTYADLDHNSSKHEAQMNGLGEMGFFRGRPQGFNKLLKNLKKKAIVTNRKLNSSKNDWAKAAKAKAYAKLMARESANASSAPAPQPQPSSEYQVNSGYGDLSGSSAYNRLLRDLKKTAIAKNRNLNSSKNDLIKDAKAKAYAKLMAKEIQNKIRNSLMGYDSMGADKPPTTASSVAGKILAEQVLNDPALKAQMNALAKNAGDKATESARKGLNTFVKKNKNAIFGGLAGTAFAIGLLAYALLKPRAVKLSVDTVKQLAKKVA